MTDPAQAIEKFSNLLDRFLQQDSDGATGESAISLIARSPAMAAARALSLHATEIRRRQIPVRLVFAKLAPVDQLAQLSSALQLVDPRNTSQGRIRFIRNGALLDAHEQLVLGDRLCWTGDMLRRCDEHRNGLDLVEEGQRGPVRLAELSFNAMWSVAKPIPARALSGHPLAQAFASVDPALAVAGMPGVERPGHIPGAPVFTRH